jgi:methionine-rich copper-binding protein CopC
MTGPTQGTDPGPPLDSAAVSGRHPRLLASLGERAPSTLAPGAAFPSSPTAAGQATRRLVPVLMAGVLSLLVAAPVLAHAEFVSSDPADGAVLASPPTTITLTFSEGLDSAKSSIELVGPDGSSIATAKPAGDGDETMTLGGLSLTAGSYNVKWTSVSLDTDILRGTASFTVGQGASSGPVPTGGDTVPAGNGSDVVLPILVALVLVAVVGAYVLRRSRSAGS